MATFTFEVVIVVALNEIFASKSALSSATVSGKPARLRQTHERDLCRQLGDENGQGGRDRQKRQLPTVPPQLRYLHAGERRGYPLDPATTRTRLARHNPD